MTVPVYAGTRHVRQAAVHALTLRLGPLVQSLAWSGEQWPTPLPDLAGTMTGPWGAMPDGGGVYFRAAVTGDKADPVPFVRVEDAGVVPVDQSDTEADWYWVQLDVRARVGAGPVEGVRRLTDALHATCEALCQAASVVLAGYLAASARELDPEAAFGVCLTEVVGGPANQTTSPAPTEGTGQVTCDYVQRIQVLQRRYHPAGVFEVTQATALLTDLGQPLLTDFDQPLTV